MSAKFLIGDYVEVSSGGYTGTKGVVLKVYNDPKDGEASYSIKSTRVVGYSYSVGTDLIFMESRLELVESHRERIDYKDVENYDEIEVRFVSGDLKRVFSGVVMSKKTSDSITEFFTKEGHKIFSTKFGAEVYLIKKGNPPHPLEGAKKDFKFKADNRLYTKYKGNLWILDHYNSSGDFIDSSMVNDSSARDGFDLFNGKVF
jgi:hypothetical protein